MSGLKLYGLIAIVVVIAVLGILLKISWADIDDLKAEKAAIQHKLDAANADIEVSVANHNRMVLEKDRLIASLEAQAETERQAAIYSARIDKDIDNATDGTACRDSDPVRRTLRGLWDNEHGDGGKAVDRVPAAGRSGKAAGVP